MINDLARAIRSRRKALGLTIDELAERAHVGTNYLGLIERGRQTPSIEKTYDIAAALQCTVDDLCFKRDYTGIEFLFDGVEGLERESYLSLMKIIHEFQISAKAKGCSGDDGSSRCLDDFGKEIRKRRKSHGWTIEKLAEQADIGSNYVSRIERGLQSPSIVIASRLSAALNCSLNDLCYGRRSPALTYFIETMETVEPDDYETFIQLVQVFTSYINQAE